MTTGDSAKHATRRPSLPGNWRPAWSAGRLVPGRSAFRAWRHGRPFSGGLLLALAGIELLAIPLSGVLSHGAIKLVVYIGIGGVFGVLIGMLLITAGIAVWVNPGHRVFYGVAGVVLGILSFPASNLGGFFLCMLLAIIGGSLAFAWTPAEPAAAPAPYPAVSDASPPDPTPPDATLPEPAAREEPPPPPRLWWQALALPLVAASGMAVGHPGAAAAPAARSQPAQTCILGLICVGSSPTPTPTPAPSSPAPTCRPAPLPTALLPTALPTALPTSLPALPTCLPTALPSGALPTSLPTPSLPVPAGAGVPGTSPSAGTGKPAAKAKAKDSTAGAGLVAPAATSVITADSVSMTHFTYQGNVKLPLARGGTVTMMKFTASSLTLSGHVADAVTEAGTTAVTSSPVMAFNGHVVLYATRLSGKLAGVPLTFTPDTVSSVLLTVANLLTSNVPITMTSVTTDQATGTADSLVYGPGGGGFSVVLH